MFLGSGGYYAFYQLVNCLVTNNIFYGARTAAQVSYTNVIFKNNISFGGTETNFPPSGTNVTASGNLEATDPGFVNMPAVGTSPPSYTFDFTYDPSLTGTPLTATDGTQVGIYGGSSPYKNTGSVLPVVKTFTAPTNVKQGTNTTADIVVTGN